MYKYPSIKQLRNVVYNAQHDKVSKPIQFFRTAKIDGSNCSVVMDLASFELKMQSRNRVIDPKEDYRGFSKFVKENDSTFLELFEDYIVLSRKPIPAKATHIIFYGEWCGEGIRKGVAVSKLKKMFVIFDVGYVVESKEDVQLDADFYHNCKMLYTSGQIFSILEFGLSRVSVDFSNPQELQDKLMLDVYKAEKVCPVGEYFGVIGAGEGYIYTSACGNYKFKMKGEAQSVSNSKIRTLEQLEALSNVSKFVSEVLLVPRLEQGIEYLQEMGIPVERKSTGAFINWVWDDVEKEEGDLIIELGLDSSMVRKEVSRVSRLYFTEKL